MTPLWFRRGARRSWYADEQGEETTDARLAVGQAPDDPGASAPIDSESTSNIGGEPDPDHVSWPKRDRRKTSAELTKIAADAVNLATCLDQVAAKALVAAVSPDGAGNIAELRAAFRQLTLVADWGRRAGDKISGIAARVDALSKVPALKVPAEPRPSVETSRGGTYQFGANVSRGDLRIRQYERVPVNGAPATLIVSNGARVSTVIQDISSGGAALVSDYPVMPGEDVLLALPGSPWPVSALIVRRGDGIVSVGFCQDKATMEAVDNVIDLAIKFRRGDFRKPDIGLDVGSAISLMEPDRVAGAEPDPAEPRRAEALADLR